MDNAEQAMQNLGRGIIQFGDAVVEVLTPFMAKVYEFGTALLEAHWDAYREAGMPFGATDEGMMRWIDEQGQLHAAQVNADYEAQRQWVVDDFKRHLAEGE